jgi:hypothetical protein
MNAKGSNANAVFMRVHSRLKVAPIDLSLPHHNLFSFPALKIGKTTNGHE